MRVSDSNKVLFVHVQKTGGSTIDRIFDQEVPDARRMGKHRRHARYEMLMRWDPVVTDYWSFGFVRNPWARMVSWFTMIQAVWGNIDAGNPKAVRKLEKFGHVWLPLEPLRHDFETFVVKGTQEHEKIARPQRDMLVTPQGREVDFTGRTENFLHDVNIVRQHLNLEPVAEIPRTNATTGKDHYSTYYTDRTRKWVADVFAADIEAYDYSFEDRT